MEFVLKRMDPVKRQPERGSLEEGGMSPMDPPDAYEPPNMEPVAVEDMHPHLQQMVAEHQPFLLEVERFENTILAIRKSGYTKEADGQLKHFLNFMDEEFIAHNRREEATLFPLLKNRLLATTEHGSGKTPITPVDLMQDEHLKAVQLAAVILNFLGLAFRIPDEKIRLIVLDAALEQGQFLVELLRLHMFREDNLIFPLAHQLITAIEFEQM
ncbi:MAG: hemerythrin domain-containing protein [Rhodoferax sp.]|nr:hemerythrin domain-containing protein [Rhodoferax sp.]